MKPCAPGLPLSMAGRPRSLRPPWNRGLLSWICAICQCQTVKAAPWSSPRLRQDDRLILRTGPLMRTLLLQVDDEDYIFLLVMHHIISDAWSLAICAREINAHYKAYVTNEPAWLRHLTIQHSDFTQWQRETIQGDFLQHLRRLLARTVGRSSRPGTPHRSSSSVKTDLCRLSTVC